MTRFVVTINTSTLGTMFVKIADVRKCIFILFALIAGQGQIIAQTVNPIVTKELVLLGDTIPTVELKEVEILSLKIPKTRRGRRRLTRMIYNIKKVYPYAKLAGIKLRQYDYLLSHAKNERERKKIMKRAEKEITQQYGKPLEDLTFTQGKILIKLIDRETGNTSYDLLQILRGKFTAFFYQVFARVWGYNLKIKYDPNGEDHEIETIVRMIEMGRL